MSDQQSARLIEAVRKLKEKVRGLGQQYAGRSLGEQDTKAALIDPLLEALGWNTRDPEEVKHEYRPTPKDNPVDYCLRLDRRPKLLVEAKGLGQGLADPKRMRQTLNYASNAGAEWCVLTNGDHYRIYNAGAVVPADLKLLCEVRLSEAPEEEAVNLLALISRSNMAGDKLKRVWQIYHADRRVASTLRELIDSADPKLVLLIRNRIRDLRRKEVAACLHRLDIRIEALKAPYEPKEPPRKPQSPASQRPRKPGPVVKGGTHIGTEPKLTLPQLRVLAALDGDPPPAMGRRQLAERAGYTGLSGTITRAINGVGEGSPSCAPMLGLLALGLMKRLKPEVGGEPERRYQITPVGQERLKRWLAENGPLPPPKGPEETTNLRYKRQ